MNIIVLLLMLIPISQAAAPQCNELGKILQDMENDLQRAKLPKCAETTAAILKEKNIPEDRQGFLKELACQDFSSVDAALNQLQIERAIADGVEKVREEVKTAQSAGNVRKFEETLEIAEALERITSAKIADKELFSVLKENLANIDPEKFPASFKKICNGDEAEICKKPFELSPVAAKEIVELLKQSDGKEETIKGIREQLAIKRKVPIEGNSSYSFAEMKKLYEDAFTDNKKTTTDEVRSMQKAKLKAVRSLEQFEFNPDYPLVKDLLAQAKSKRTVAEKLINHLQDGVQRQKFDVQHKVSAVYFDMQKDVDMPETDKTACQNAKSSYASAVNCMEALKFARAHGKITGTLSPSKVEGFAKVIDGSKDFANALENKINECKNGLGTGDVLPEPCLSGYTVSKEKLDERITLLTDVKNKIKDQNKKKITMRNYALQKWGDQKCGLASSNMDSCEYSGTLETEAKFAVSDVMNIAILFSPEPKSVEEAKSLCEDDEVNRSKSEDRLCSYFTDKTSDVVTTNNSNEGNITGSLAPEDAGQVRKDAARDGLIQSGAEVLKQALGFLIPKQTVPMGVNPYPYNPWPVSSNSPPLGIADTIMYNARVQGGYGYYSPTPGYTPGTSFGREVSFSGYKPVSTPSSKYFSF